VIVRYMESTRKYARVLRIGIAGRKLLPLCQMPSTFVRLRAFHTVRPFVPAKGVIPCDFCDGRRVRN
jgi:hypothetical protein